MNPLAPDPAILPLAELLPAAWREARRRFMIMVIVFVLIALVALVVAYTWPKQYYSSTSILVSEDNIVLQLLDGRAVATSVQNRAEIAREVILSRRVMDEVLAAGGWLDDSPGPAKRELMAQMIEGRTSISTTPREDLTTPRDHLIIISYWDKDPRRARLVTERLAELFIAESTEAKRRESHEAYEFVADQVNQYHAILMEAEQRLKQFLDSSEDARPGSGDEVSRRVTELRHDIDNWRLERMELQSRHDSLEAQLSGLGTGAGSPSYQAQLRQRIASAQDEYDTLLRELTPRHPDVVRVRLQLDDLRAQLAASSGERSAPPLDGAGFQQGQLHQEMISSLARTSQEMAGLNARIAEAERLLNEEMERRRRVGATDTELAELSRDYEVNRRIYEDLLDRLESARLSMRLDEVGRGLTFSIHEPAMESAQAVGPRFAHLALGGMLAAVATPLGLLLLLVRLDPRIRSAQAVERVTQIPILAEAPRYWNDNDRRRFRVHAGIALLLVSLTFVAYAIAGWFRLGLAT